MTETGDDLYALSKPELDEFQKVNSQTISDLEKDIQLLKIQIRQFGPNSLRPSSHRVIQRSDGSSNLEEIQIKLDTEIRKLSKRVLETSRLTDITVEKVEREVLELDEASCKKRFTLELKVMGRDVIVVYDTEDNWASTPPSSQISWFEVKFEEDINNVIGEQINDAADSQAFHSVFDLLKSYLQWQADQRTTAEHFRQLYPNLVTIQESHNDTVILTIANPDPRHPTFHLTWGRVTAGSHIEADLTLRVEASQELLARDSHGVIRDAASFFSTMVDTDGVKAAIDNLVQIVGGVGGERGACPSV